MERFDHDRMPRFAARRAPGKILALCAALAFPGFSYAGQARSAEEIWKALENLPAAEREKKLVEGAKIEGGEMVWYTNTGVDNANRYILAFKKADESSLEEVLALRGTWGRDKTVEYLRKLRPQLLIRRGRDNIANLMMAGEAPLAVTIYPYNAETLRAQGAPIDWVAPDVVTTLVYPLTMSRSSPHPHAAALFYDFLLSDAPLRSEPSRLF